MHVTTVYMRSQPSQRPSWAGPTASTGPATSASVAPQVSQSYDVDTSLGYGGPTIPAVQMETMSALPTAISPGEQIHLSPRSWFLR